MRVGAGTPPRLYNDALDGIIASFNGLSSERLVRLYAVANIAMADAAIAAWREKVRPVQLPDSARALLQQRTARLVA